VAEWGVAMNTTTTMGGHVEDYLRLRRALGFKLEREGRWLHQFATYLNAAEETNLTSAAALAWAGQAAPALSNRPAARLGVVRRFAVYLHTIDPATEVPPPAVFPRHRRRPTPYLWSSDETARLLDGARALSRPLRAATHETLFGLLAATGMRLGEAIGLDRADVDLHAGVVTIRQAKFDRSRLVPLHQTATAALRCYIAVRDRLCPTPRSGAFFLSSVGTALTRSGVEKVFRHITTTAGIRTDAARPRIHDLRHSLAVRTLIEWQRGGLSIDQHIGALSAYLGHISPADTYWYLSASPELMQLAAQRLHDHFGRTR
jgi:integrase/recombinase XerD